MGGVLIYDSINTHHCVSRQVADRKCVLKALVDAST